MRKKGRTLVTLLLVTAFVCGTCPAQALALGRSAISAPAERVAARADILAATADYLLETTPRPGVGEVGGEWTVLGLARSGRTVPEGYYRTYCDALAARLSIGDGVLDARKNTASARAALALAALGQNPRAFRGYDLIAPLLDCEGTLAQGTNGAIWALIALNCGAVPQSDEVEAARTYYLAELLRRQLPDGGFSLADSADPDITAMALCALAGMRGEPGVEAATSRALDCLAHLQLSDGGFASWDVPNAESVSQVIVALGMLGIPLDDPRFTKGAGLSGALLGYYREGAGFAHAEGLADDGRMATEQAFCALVAARRLEEGRCGLYRMEDAQFVPDGGAPGEGLAGKHPDVQRQPVQEPGKTFADIAAHPNRAAIEALAARGIIGGRAADEFAPDGSMTRAEFATIVVRALGLSPRIGERFYDVQPESWYAPFVGAASDYGIIYGDSERTFNPEGTITREAAAVMVARAAALCGMFTGREELEILDTLTQFDDYKAVSDWARAALAFCYDSGILDNAALEIRPKEAVLRCEIAEMLYQLLERANLL